jgi:8-oxo-dGTP pyrophosphatase MutT (NUDIX family)
MVVVTRPSDGALLVSGDGAFERPLGGGIEFGESSLDAARREFREELGVELDGLKLLGVLENRPEIDGTQAHEIVFVYSAGLADPSGYDWVEQRILDHLPASKVRVYWRDREATALPLVPSGLTDLLGS